MPQHSSKCFRFVGVVSIQPRSDLISNEIAFNFALPPPVLDLVLNGSHRRRARRAHGSYNGPAFKINRRLKYLQRKPDSSNPKLCAPFPSKSRFNQFKDTHTHTHARTQTHACRHPLTLASRVCVCVCLCADDSSQKSVPSLRSRTERTQKTYARMFCKPASPVCVFSRNLLK